jgi:hypothetical protein
MLMYTRHATATCARSNNSILSVSDIKNTTTTIIDNLDTVNQGVGWLLNYTAASLPPVSSPAFILWNHNQELSEHDWAVVSYDTLKSTLAFVIWFFSENSYGNPELLNSAKCIVQILPEEYQTTASLCQIYIKLVIDSRMLALYAVLEILPLCFCWMVLLWRVVTRCPPNDTILYPLIDFLSRAEIEPASVLLTNSTAKEKDRDVIARIETAKARQRI